MGLYTIPQAAKELGIPKSGVMELIQHGTLECVPPGTTKFIKPETIFNLIGTPASKNDGYPHTEELESTLPNGNISSDGDGDDMTYLKYRGSVWEDKKNNRYLVQIRDKATRKAVYNKTTFTDRYSAEQHLQQKLFELNAEAYAYEHGLQSVEPVQAPTVLPQEVAPTTTYPRITLREFALSFLNQISTEATSRTMEGYRIGLAMLSNSVLDKYMYEITADDIRREFARLVTLYKQSTLDRVRITLCLLFKRAAEGDVGNKILPIIPYNPIAGLGRQKSKVLDADDAKGILTFSDEDIEILFSTSKSYNFELYTMFTILECTGMRPGEMRALRWDALNLEDPAEVPCHL